MEAIVTLIVLVVGLSSFALTSISWGADSRDALPDDHRR